MSRVCPPPGTAPDEHPSQYMLGHHLTLDSYMQSVVQGCVFCSREGQEIVEHSTMSKLGYYSLFTVNLDKALNPRMEIFKPGARLGFQSLPVIDGMYYRYLQLISVMNNKILLSSFAPRL